ncbi:hypothetical protein PR048_006343 [Dryococelus australis]|uniref:Uncharacterized protein n=1 Tax=Dryococelus australis TaxID=614101 RepID=A0ABQ9IAU7_9NEOP|nr:hypothetical protein PR048_006343 [Dryococelus australis]
MMAERLVRSAIPATNLHRLEQVELAWNTIPQDDIRHIYDRLYARLQDCIVAKEGYTRYRRIGEFNRTTLPYPLPSFSPLFDAVNVVQYKFATSSDLRSAIGAAVAERRTRFNTRLGRPRIFACGNRAGQCRLSIGFLGGSPVSPPFYSGYIRTLITLIGSQDLIVKSRLNLVTHSLIRTAISYHSNVVDFNYSESTASVLLQGESFKRGPMGHSINAPIPTNASDAKPAKSWPTAGVYHPAILMVLMDHSWPRCGEHKWPKLGPYDFNSNGPSMYHFTDTRWPTDGKPCFYPTASSRPAVPAVKPQSADCGLLHWMRTCVMSNKLAADAIPPILSYSAQFRSQHGQVYAGRPCGHEFDLWSSQVPLQISCTITSAKGQLSTSVRAIYHEAGSSYSAAVWGVLNKQLLDPYHIRKVQTVGSTLIMFHSCRYVHSWNRHVRTDENPYDMTMIYVQRTNYDEHVDSQNNVFLVETCRLPASINGYYKFLEQLLEDVPPWLRGHMWLDDRDGAPPHNDGCSVITSISTSKKVGSANPITWPARSPDLNTDVFSWAHVKSLVYETRVDMALDNVATIIDACDTIDFLKQRRAGTWNWTGEMTTADVNGETTWYSREKSCFLPNCQATYNQPREKQLMRRVLRPAYSLAGGDLHLQFVTRDFLFELGYRTARTASRGSNNASKHLTGLELNWADARKRFHSELPYCEAVSILIEGLDASRRCEEVTDQCPATARPLPVLNVSRDLGKDNGGEKNGERKGNRSGCKEVAKERGDRRTLMKLLETESYCRNAVVKNEQVKANTGNGHVQQPMLCCSNSRGGVVVRLLVFHLGEPGSIPGGVALGFSHAEIVPDDSTRRRVFSGISHFPRSCIPALLHIHLSLPS